jgi:hypothetical protein
LEYTRQIEKHNFTVMASHEAQESEWKALSAGRTGFLTNDIFDVNAGNPTSATNGGGTYPWSMESFLGRVNYNYDNRYLLTATFRRDGSPYFGPDNRWGNFPSASLAWRVSRESFFDVDFISELKLRVETGLTGNQGTGSGIYAPLATGATPWGTGLRPSPSQIQNCNGKKRRRTTLVSMPGSWKTELLLKQTIMKKLRTTSLCRQVCRGTWVQMASPGSVGAPLVNAGSLKTKGWNLTFITTNIENKNFRWNQI